MTLYLANEGFFDEAEESDVKALQTNVLDYIELNCHEAADEINEKKVLTEENKKRILETANKYKASAVK